MNRTRVLLLATAVPLVIVIGLLLSVGLGGSDEPPRSPAGTSAPRPSDESPRSGTSAPRPFVPVGARRIDVGRGARGAAIFRPGDGDGGAPGPVVVFLHGWSLVDPASYGAWIGHLVREGATVVYPTYQAAPFVDVVTPLANTLVALRLALAEVRVAPGRLVVAGHSAGGALAADYAASALAAGLPVPAAVFSVYPGRSLRGIALRIPSVSARRIPAATSVRVLAGARDRVVGTRVARTIARTATQARTTLRIVRDRAVDDHGAPQRSGAPARRAFWAPLDRLVAATG